MCRRRASRASFCFFSDSSRCRRTGAVSKRWCVSSFRIATRRAGASADQPPLELRPEASSRYRSARLVRSFVEPRTDVTAPETSVASRVPSSARRTSAGVESIPPFSFSFSFSSPSPSRPSRLGSRRAGARGRAEPGVLGHRAQRRRQALRVVLAVAALANSTTPPPNVSPPQHRHPSSHAAAAPPGRTACTARRESRRRTLAALCPPTARSRRMDRRSRSRWITFVFFAFFAFFASKEVTASDSGAPRCAPSRAAPSRRAARSSRRRRLEELAALRRVLPQERVEGLRARERQRRDVVHARGRARVDGLVVTHAWEPRARRRHEPGAAGAEAAGDGGGRRPRPGTRPEAWRLNLRLTAGRAVRSSCASTRTHWRTALVEAESRAASRTAKPPRGARQPSLRNRNLALRPGGGRQRVPPSAYSSASQSAEASASALADIGAGGRGARSRSATAAAAAAGGSTVPARASARTSAHR